MARAGNWPIFSGEISKSLAELSIARLTGGAGYFNFRSFDWSDGLFSSLNHNHLPDNQVCSPIIHSSSLSPIARSVDIYTPRLFLSVTIYSELVWPTYKPLFVTQLWHQQPQPRLRSVTFLEIAPRRWRFYLSVVFPWQQQWARPKLDSTFITKCPRNKTW